MPTSKGSDFCTGMFHSSYLECKFHPTQRLPKRARRTPAALTGGDFCTGTLLHETLAVFGTNQHYDDEPRVAHGSVPAAKSAAKVGMEQ